MALRAFPVLYAKDVERVAAFYTRLGFQEHFRMPDATGAAGFIGLRRDTAELGVTTENSPRMLAGVELRDPADMPWGERVAFVKDPEGNVVTLAA